jgi:uracil-DNA glycosylase
MEKNVKQKQLEDLNEKMTNECRCTLKFTAINVVSGEGNADAKILFIGEALGKRKMSKANLLSVLPESF